MEKKLFSKYMYPKASFFFYNFYPQNSILRKKKSNYKNNCILDGFLVLLKNEKKNHVFSPKSGYVANRFHDKVWLS